MEVKYFRAVLLEDAIIFIEGLNPKIADKVMDKIEKAETNKDPKVFKKLKDDIWEFRMRYGFVQIRLLAFWDKSDKEKTLVLATHGFIKKTDRVPGNELTRAKNIMNKYFELKK